MTAAKIASSAGHGPQPPEPIVRSVDPVEESPYRIHYVRVTNNLDVAFNDRHDGVPVTINPGKSENLPLDMAAHFFGYHDGVKPETMLRHVSKRQGWNTPEHVKQDPISRKTLAEQYFAKLDIKPVKYRLVEETVDTESPIPADPLPPPIDDDELPSPLSRRGKLSQDETSPT